MGSQYKNKSKGIGNIEQEQMHKCNKREREEKVSKGNKHLWESIKGKEVEVLSVIEVIEGHIQVAIENKT